MPEITRFAIRIETAGVTSYVHTRMTRRAVRTTRTLNIKIYMITRIINRVLFSHLPGRAAILNVAALCADVSFLTNH